MTDTLGFVTLPNTSDDSANESPTLRIDCFNPRTVIDFGDVKAGKTAVKCLTLENPQCEDVHINTAKFPTTKTIVLHGYSAEESRARIYRVPQFSCIDINIAWTPDIKSTGGMRHTLELEWERKRFQVVLVGFIVEVKQKKKIMKRIVRRNIEKPLDLSLGKDENSDSQRFKGIAKQTSKNELNAAKETEKKQTKDVDKKQHKEPHKKQTRVLGECHDNAQKLPVKPLKTGRITDPLVKPLQTSSQTSAPIKPLPLQKDGDTLIDIVVSPFSVLDTPAEGPMPEVAPTPVQPLCLQEPISSSSGEGSAGTPRKRRTWAPPDNNPLFTTPTVLTRAALKRIGEQSLAGQSLAGQTFMECHATLPVDSLLEHLSPPRDRGYEKPLPAPFSPPNESVIVHERKPAAGPIPVPTFTTSPDDNPRCSGGPLTATPRHPSMAVNNAVQEDAALPCFDTSIIPHFTSKTRCVPVEPTTPARKSENFVIPLIETTSSTVNLSQEEAPTNSVKTEQKISSQAVKTEPTKKQPAVKSALASGKVHPKGKKPEVQFRAPLIKSATIRPKTAPGPSALSRRDILKKSGSHDVPPQRLHPVKRRSVSASRAETSKPVRDLNARPAKRKDLVTPNMVPGKSPNKRPLQRVAATDLSFREKRHRSCDVIKTPNKGKMSRRSVAQPTTGTRVKMQTSKTRSMALPRHPLALSAATNIYFDEKWKAKQERGFTVWMNFYLCSPEGSLPPDYQNTRDVCKNAARKARKSVVAPDKAKILAKLQAERKLLQAERRACAIFQSAERALLKLEEEINEGGLAIREDRKLDADLGLKDQLIDLVLCYNPVWLRLGLEVLYEEVLPLAEHRDLPGLVAFLNSRFVNNPVIAQHFAHPTVPGSYGAGYERELRKFTLKRFLMLVLLLDMAKTARVLEYDPCLFCLKAPHKTSRAILLSFSNSFLSGEGDITKHLGYIGYAVKHEQKHIEEVDYTVHRIETELRDGTRLTRLTEIITESSLTDKLRVPAVSRLQKLHNVGITLNKLQEEGLKLDNVPGGPIVSKSVVDGNQNLTLALIWRVIFQYSITRILAVDQLRAEIRILREILSKRKHLKPSSYDDEEDFVLGLPGRRLSVDERGFFNSHVLSTLLEWCQIVCSYYDVPVDNFTVSFSDGRVLCLLVHHYHPELLPFHRIRLRTSLSHQLMELNASRDYLSNSFLDPDLHRDNEKDNFRALGEAMKGLKEVPPMMFSGDMIGTIPDEKVVITFVAYLCAALVDISQEFRAAQRIQRAWRRHKFLAQVESMREKRREIIKLQALARAMFARRQFVLLELNREAIIAQRKEYAARKIQCTWRSLKITRQARCEFVEKRAAAVKIQRFYKAILEERWKDRISAARTIQTTWRGYSGRKKYLAMQRSAVKLQTAYRMYRCRRDYLFRRDLEMKHAAAKKIQDMFHSYRETFFHRTRFLEMKSSALRVQCFYRGYLVRKQLAAERRSVTMIQAAARGYLVGKRIARQDAAAYRIQVVYRGYLQMRQEQEKYQQKREAALKIQSTWRMLVVRRSISEKRTAAVLIQAHWRMHSERAEYLRTLESIKKIQTAWRRCQVREKIRDQKIRVLRTVLVLQSCYRGLALRAVLASQHRHATKIQARFRGHVVRKDIFHQHQSAVKIQSCYRGYLNMKAARSHFIVSRHSAILLQSHIRSYLVRREIARASSAATTIQRIFRGYCARSCYLAQRSAAVCIQGQVRAWLAGTHQRAHYLKLYATVTSLQALYRGTRTRRRIREQAAAATKIQSTWRMYCTRRSYQQKRVAAVCVQAVWRMRQTRIVFLQMKKSAVQVQSYYRMYRCVREFQRSKESAVLIQACWRGYVARQQYRQTRGDVIRLQALFRGHKVHKTFNCLRAVRDRAIQNTLSLSQVRDIMKILSD